MNYCENDSFGTLKGRSLNTGGQVLMHSVSACCHKLIDTGGIVSWTELLHPVVNGTQLMFVNQQIRHKVANKKGLSE